jgi:hypothetical protein
MPSSRIVLSYRSHLGDTQPAATRALTLNVEPKLHLSISAPVTSVNETIHFSGVLAGPIPPGGKQLILLARGVEVRRVRSRKSRKPRKVKRYGSWVEFHTMTTTATGSFHAEHRFHEPGALHLPVRGRLTARVGLPVPGGTLQHSVGVRDLKRAKKGSGWSDKRTDRG